jgi:hypothetical protein
MMEGMSDSDEEDDEDEEGGGGGGDVKAAAAGASAGGSAVVAEKDSGIDGAAEAVGAAGFAAAEGTSKEADSSPVKTSAGSSAENEADALPVCIVCQADANAEDTEGNARLMGYLSLVQASTVLAAHRATNSAEATNDELIRLASGNIPSISSKIAPKKELLDRCSAHLSFCGHCTFFVYYNCIQYFLRVCLCWLVLLHCRSRLFNCIMLLPQVCIMTVSTSTWSPS